MIVTGYTTIYSRGVGDSPNNLLIIYRKGNKTPYRLENLKSHTSPWSRLVFTLFLRFGSQQDLAFVSCMIYILICIVHYIASLLCYVKMWGGRFPIQYGLGTESKLTLAYLTRGGNPCLAKEFKQNLSNPPSKSNGRWISMAVWINFV